MQTQTSDSGQAGVVSKKAPGYYDVHFDGQVISCTLSSNLGKDFEMTCLPWVDEVNASEASLRP